MIGHAFKVRGDDRVYLLIYRSGARVWDLGPDVRDLADASELGHGRADSNSEAWGRLILLRRQGGYAALYTIDDLPPWRELVRA